MHTAHWVQELGYLTEDWSRFKSVIILIHLTNNILQKIDLIALLKQQWHATDFKLITLQANTASSLTSEAF